MVYPTGTNFFKISCPKIDHHTLIIVYLIPVECPISKVSQGQQSLVVYFGIVDVIGVDILHKSISVAASSKYPP